jgi:hypothetical protein
VTNRRTVSTCPGAAATTLAIPSSVRVALVYRPSSGQGRRTTQPGRSSRRTTWDSRDSDPLARVATVRTSVHLSLFTDFREFGELTPGPHQPGTLEQTLDQVVAWSSALAPLRLRAVAA